MHENSAELTVGGMALLLMYINPYAAIGAAFGCVFFLQYPSILSRGRRFMLAVFSWGVGYATGMFWYGSGPPWLPEAFLPALVAAALGSSVFTAFAALIDRDGELPPWLVSLLSILPWRR